MIRPLWTLCCLSGLLVIGGNAIANDPPVESSKPPSNGSEGQRESRPDPTFADVRYGPYARNLLDVYVPKGQAKGDWPVCIFFHGGGWLGGDKQAVDPRWFLSKGIAVVSANYRYTMGSPDAAPYPGPMNDAKRVVQYVRHRALDWNLNSDRVALTGSSAGAVMALWIAYQPDMSDAASNDVVDQQSTRVCCVLPEDMPTTLNRDWILENVGGPKGIHIATYPLFRIQNLDELDVEPKRAMVAEASPVSHVTADDPPTYMTFQLPMTPTPLPSTTDQNLSIHHPRFGLYLQEELRKRGVPCFLRYKGNEGEISKAEFLQRFLFETR
ncbi:MAG: alpha/beta hydrolase [Planctomycetota bacterium]